MADGEWVSAPMGDFQKNPNMEVVYENGVPSYFREVVGADVDVVVVDEKNCLESKAVEVVEVVVV